MKTHPDPWESPIANSRWAATVAAVKACQAAVVDLDDPLAEELVLACERLIVANGWSNRGRH